MRTTPAEGRFALTILGLGNVLCQDDGLGVRAVAQLLRRFVITADPHEPPREAPDVRVLDGGTLGLSLLPVLQTTRVALLVDAIDDGSPPGTLVRLVGHEVVARAALRLSVHQIGVADLLSASDLVGDGPDELILLGLVPSETALAVGLSPIVARALPALVMSLADEIRHHGFFVLPAPDVLHAAAGSQGRDPLDLVHLGL